MRASAIAVAVLLATTFAVVAAPSASAASPDLPPNHSGCGYFHWHNGNVAQGTLPGYHYHHCF